MSEDEITVLFSGGSDSTLAAALMCTRFRKVHLLTYRTSPMYNLQKAKKSVRLLQNKFGRDKITHRFIDSDEIFKKIYNGDYLNDLMKYKGFLSTCVCAACGLSMQVSTIIFDLKHDIHFTCDGEHYEEPPVHEQIPSVLEMIRGLYKEYGISYENPVYKIKATDVKLFESGITSEKDVKIQPFAHGKRNAPDGLYTRWISTQPDCYGNIIGGIYLHCFFIPLYGQRRHETLTIEYYREKIEICREYLQNRLRVRC